MESEAPGDAEAMQAYERVSPNARIDISDFYDRKQEALRAHHTQRQDWEMFGKLPEELQRNFFGCEHYLRVVPALAEGVVIEDLFDGIR
jgi:LmbE family N-acetylglucosaminyl deacetylase